MSTGGITPRDLSYPEILNEKDKVNDFVCGVKDIDIFMHEEALQYQKDRLGVTYLFRQNGKIVGFATLSMADLKREKMSATDRLKHKIENYPALLIGQLAVCAEHHGRDIGTYICDFCFSEALRFSRKLDADFSP
jgi:hypothetical protein